MEKYFSQLIGLEKEKPFECVGSRDEINASITLTIRDFETSFNKGDSLPYLFEKYKEQGLYEANLPTCEQFIDFCDEVNLIPEKFAKMLAKKGIESGKIKE